MTLNREGIVDIYLKDLGTIKQPGLHLAKFMWEVLGKSPNKNDIIQLSRLVKLYGRLNVFTALLEVIEVENLGNDYYGLIVYIIKRNLLKGKSTSSEDLSSYVTQIKKDIGKKKKVDIRENPFKEDKSE